MQAGDRMAFCAGLGPDRQFYSFDLQAGRPAILVLAGEAGTSPLQPLLTALAPLRQTLASLQGDLLLLLGPAAGLRAIQSGGDAVNGVPLVVCQSELPPGGKAAQLVVIDRAARVAASWPVGEQDPATQAAAALHAVERLAREAARDCLLPAPVLTIPHLLDAAFCTELIERFEQSATFDSGISSVGADGASQLRLDHGKKRRRDWLIEPPDDIHGRILDALSRRCVPELRRAFQHEASHVDRVLVARYDETGGYFRRHRDNVGPSVAFRQFALSVNLNTDAYEGGCLLFPEYNDHRYRPAAGDGIVFSASLLHEATPVTRGRRYVLLTFLHDAAAESRRLAQAA